MRSTRIGNDETSKLPILGGLALALAIVATVILLAPDKPPIPVVVLPTPNGYDTLSKAGAIVAEMPQDYDTTMDADVLRDCVVANSEAFALIDEALRQDCVVPVEYDKGYESVVESMNASSNIRQAMRLLMVKARLAELDGDLVAAATAQTELLLHSRRIADEGLLVHAQVSLVYQKSALQNLNRLAPQLGNDQKKTVLSAFKDVDRQGMNVDDIRTREEALSYESNMGILNRWHMLFLRRASAPAYEQLRAQREMSELMFDRVFIELSE